MLSGQAGIAIAEIIVYVPCAIALGFVMARHGFRKQLGFYYLVAFLLLRFTGASLEIAAWKDPNNANLFATAAIMSSIGLSALIFVSFGVLMRIIDMTSKHQRASPLSPRYLMIDKYITRVPIIGQLIDHLILSPMTASSRRSRFIQLLQLPALAGLVLCIIGGTDISSSNTTTIDQGRNLFQGGVAIFIFVYAALMVFTFHFTAFDYDKIPSGERRCLAAVLISLPLLTVRITWTILAIYTKLLVFQYLNGRAFVQGLMGTLPEMLIVILFVTLGLMIPRYRPDYVENEEKFNSNRRAMQRGAAGPMYNCQNDNQNSQQNNYHTEPIPPVQTVSEPSPVTGEFKPKSMV